MISRLSLLPLLLATMSLFAPSPTGTSRQLSPGTPCVPHLDGALFPELVPQQEGWDQLWAVARKVAQDSSAGARFASDLDVEPATVRLLTDRALFVGSRVSALRGTGASASVSHVSPIAVADAILEGRDDLIRLLPDREFRRINAWADAAIRKSTYAFPPIGTLIAAGTPGAYRCHLSVSGKDHPELIPESYVWSTYFRFRSATAEKVLTEGAEYNPEALIAIQRTRLPISPDDIRFVMELATSTQAAMEAARGVEGPERSERERAAVAEIALSARAQLIRRLSKMAWLAVKHDAEIIRGGSSFDFPTY